MTFQNIQFLVKQNAEHSNRLCRARKFAFETTLPPLPLISYFGQAHVVMCVCVCVWVSVLVGECELAFHFDLGCVGGSQKRRNESTGESVYVFEKGSRAQNYLFDSSSCLGLGKMMALSTCKGIIINYD